MRGLLVSFIVTGRLFANACVISAGDEDFEPLEEAPCLRGLGSCIPNEHVRPDTDVLKPLNQRRVEREGQKPGRCRKGTEWSIPALMAPLPRTLEFIA